MGGEEEERQSVEVEGENELERWMVTIPSARKLSLLYPFLSLYGAGSPACEIFAKEDRKRTESLIVLTDRAMWCSG